jgi:mono/diheme cytochrome c family protein
MLGRSAASLYGRRVQGGTVMRLLIPLVLLAFGCAGTSKDTPAADTDAEDPGTPADTGASDGDDSGSATDTDDGDGADSGGADSGDADTGAAGDSGTGGGDTGGTDTGAGGDTGSADSGGSSGGGPDGAALFSATCGTCHGSDGHGGSGPDIVGEATSWDDAGLLGVIQNGKGDMPPQPLDNEEAQAVIDWMRTNLR